MSWLAESQTNFLHNLINIFVNSKKSFIMTMIPFNKPFLTGKEAHYMYEAVLLLRKRLAGASAWAGFSIIDRWFR